MTVRLAINGFGRIGRLVMRSIIESGRTDVQIVGINNLVSAEMSSHLLKFDSVHGVLNANIKVDGETIDVGNGPIKFSSERDPANLPWGDIGVDVAMECTGFFTTREAASKHIVAGAKKVLISGPGKGVDKTIVHGVNSNKLTSADTIVSNASCTTNCLAPVADVLNKAVGIEKGFMTAIHSYTGDQRLSDASHLDPRRARGCCAKHDTNINRCSSSGWPCIT